MAQEKGYAETDPSADIDGIGTMRKINITSSLLFDRYFDEDKIETKGIRDINQSDIKNALYNNKTIKLIGYGDENGKIYVRPEEVDKTLS